MAWWEGSGQEVPDWLTSLGKQNAGSVGGEDRREGMKDE